MSVTNGAFYGIAGRVVLLIEPHTEADPGAILLQLLIGCGAIIGEAAYAIADGAKHPPRLFGCIVGRTSKGRKGTSWMQARRVLDAINHWFVSDRIMSGITSGEGIITQVREGTSDPRMLIVETEMGNALSKMAREGNTLSPTMREAWDGGKLKNLTKREPMESVDNPSISVIAHCTRDELAQRFQAVDITNGLGNRFLWMGSDRSRVQPFSSEPDAGAMSALVQQLAYRVNNPPSGHIRFSEQGEAEWCRIYAALNETDETGAVGSILARNEAQVLRLSVLYAILDGSNVIDPCHLAAAMALWGHCERSVRCIFGTSTGNKLADRLLERLSGCPEGMSRDDVHKVIGKNRTEPELNAVLELVVRLGKARPQKIATGGRPREVWFHHSHQQWGKG